MSSKVTIANAIPFEVEDTYKMYFKFDDDVYWITGDIYGAKLCSEKMSFTDNKLTLEMFEDAITVGVTIKHYKKSDVLVFISKSCKYAIEIPIHVNKTDINNRIECIQGELAVLEERYTCLVAMYDKLHKVHLDYLYNLIKHGVSDLSEVHKKHLSMCKLREDLQSFQDRMELCRKELYMISVYA